MMVMMMMTTMNDCHGCLLSREPATGELEFWAAPFFGDERLVTPQ